MGDFWSSRIFFSSNLVGRIFFSLFSHKLSITFTFVLHAIFFFRQALAGNFFSKSRKPPPPPPLFPQELMVGPLVSKTRTDDYENEMFSMPRGARASTSIILAGKHPNRGLSVWQTIM